MGCAVGFYVLSQVSGLQGLKQKATAFQAGNETARETDRESDKTWKDARGPRRHQTKLFRRVLKVSFRLCVLHRRGGSARPTRSTDADSLETLV